jgi:hypothetical protein
MNREELFDFTNKCSVAAAFRVLEACTEANAEDKG